MPDNRLFWSASELLPTVREIQGALMKDKRVRVAAFTGSLARGFKEPETRVHDIDIVLLHSGSLPLGTVKLPFRGARPIPAQTYEILDPCRIFEKPIVDELERVRNSIPVDIVVVDVRVLWDCEYLQSLTPHAYFRDFYLRIFCDMNLPLLLLNARLRNAPYGLLKVIRRAVPYEEGAKLGFRTARIGHDCPDDKCKPSVPWDEAQGEILARKAMGTDSVSD